MLDKFRKGAQKAAIQASAFAQASTTKVASGSRDFVQTFSLPGEAEKSAKILESFLGILKKARDLHPELMIFCYQLILRNQNPHSTPSQRPFYKTREVRFTKCLSFPLELM